jgi:HD-GYP domain-containing protein (c-di-GMP phosphodiesterase class II)
MTAEFDPLDLPRSAATEAALQFARDHEDLVIFHHSVRCYLIARSIGQRRGWTDDLDDEVLFLASILHDLGTPLPPAQRNFSPRWRARFSHLCGES